MKNHKDMNLSIVTMIVDAPCKCSYSYVNTTKRNRIIVENFNIIMYYVYLWHYVYMNILFQHVVNGTYSKGFICRSLISTTSMEQDSEDVGWQIKRLYSTPF